MGIHRNSIVSKKIVRVFTVGEEPQAPKQVSEAGLLKRIASAFRTPPAAAPTAPPPADDGDEHGFKADGETSIQQVLGRIFSVPSDSVRCILYLNDADLKSRYLTQNGYEKVASQGSIEDSVFSDSISNDPEKLDGIFAKIYTPEFDLESFQEHWIGWRPFAVLLNVKKPRWQAFVAARTPEDKRAAFLECINHKFYVAVLNTKAIRSAKVGALRDRAEREEKFNIKTFITAYSHRAAIDAARHEYEQKTTSAPAVSGHEQEIVDTVSKRAIDFVFASTEAGELKQRVKNSFADDLKTMVFRAPELRDNKPLVADVITAIQSNERIRKAGLGRFVAGLTGHPEPQKAELGAIAGLNDQDMDSLSPEEIVDKLSQKYGRDHEGLVSALRKYGFKV
jgi:hypothetical protein